MADIASQPVANWADSENELPVPVITKNADGTKTVVSFRVGPDGKKYKVIQKVRETIVKETVHPAVAARKQWTKFGEERDSAPGPDMRTTQIGEDVQLNLGTAWKDLEKEAEEKKAEESAKNATTQRIKCRTCGGDHFTSKCPFKDTLGVDSEANAAAPSATPEPEANSSVFVPPHLRNRKPGDAPAVGRGYEDRDDSTTLRITQLNEIVDEDTLRDELLRPFMLKRVTVVKDRMTGRSKGVAYVSFMSVDQAQAAIDRFDGKGYHNLIIHLEFSKPKK
ncbi:hypothetical protein BABINDRAFT_7020 [Babjeviella inositovora NRRL Y-12698]|uniref:Eukaryotic translation initiation factor 3 subunit G n=1 Tax=Babjeviella inositovora NRRL Y-12698 TaxID=984486 RepID=A0A1E3QW39_9ASCO|nr:uncharacterized protein BABINDRAFT_7020 [Babjeviella inositovora NRRL Y-12698]ODQ81197.1 hypothetical protein BABINDRAFT_7020 [Babjeviella inositovora NRRL Y-12698]